MDLSAWLIKLPTVDKLLPLSGTGPVLAVISFLGSIKMLNFPNVELMRIISFDLCERTI